MNAPWRLSILVIFIIYYNQGDLMAQSDLRPGYITTTSNDTIFGQVVYKENLSRFEKCNFIHQNENESKSYSPCLLVTTDVTVKFVVLGTEDTFLKNISFDAPVVNSFSPATFAPLTTLTVNGQNLPMCGMTGKINNQPVTLQNISATKFEFVVPSGVNAPFDLNLYLQNTEITTYTFQ